MNLDHYEHHFEQSTREIIKSLGVIQDLLKNEKKSKKVIKKEKVLERSEVLERERIQRTPLEIERDIYPERIVYEKTPTKKRKNKKKTSFSYSTFVVDTSSSSEDEDW